MDTFNLESYLVGLKGVTTLLRPYKAKCKPVIRGDSVGMIIAIDGLTWELLPEKYANTEAIISAMWNFAEWVWEQMQKTKQRQANNYG